jgi:predicted GNAT family N-acyltransferase
MEIAAAPRQWVMAMSYQVDLFNWDDARAEAAQAIRFAVFVDEQRVPAELELDEIDGVAVHALARDENGRACGTGRLFAAPEDATCAKIGRMAVLKECRGTGCGAALLIVLIEEARRRGFSRASLTAQTHAVGFYEKYGFSAYGPEFDEAGIPHLSMERGL